MEVRDTKLSAALWRAALLSIAAIFMLRLYAIFFTVHVVAFDDKGYRRLAVNNFESTSLKGAVKDVLLPYNGEVYGRVGNYTSWLALGLKFCPECNRENIFHLVNFLIFLIQGAVVYAFSFLAARDKPFSAAAAFLYLSSPICFGMNRFLMPENLVLTAPLILSFAAFRLAVKSNSVSAVSEIFAAAVAAFLIGLFSVSRDYAALSPLVISAGIFLTLLIQRRYAALAAFTLVVMPYLLRLDTSLGILFSKTDKFYCDLYYNPLHTWALHAILYVSGPAFFLFLAFIITYALYYLLRNAPSLNFKTISGWMKNDKAAVLLLAQIVLASLYIAGIAITTTRVARIAVLPLATVTGLALFLVYEILPLRKIILSKSFKVCSLFLILLSWIVMYHQLFVAFDGGKTYAYPAFDLERYNHPMYLRPLRGENDMHVCGVDSFPPCQPR